MHLLSFSLVFFSLEKLNSGYAMLTCSLISCMCVYVSMNIRLKWFSITVKVKNTDTNHNVNQYCPHIKIINTLNFEVAIVLMVEISDFINTRALYKHLSFLTLNFHTIYYRY